MSQDLRSNGLVPLTGSGYPDRSDTQAGTPLPVPHLTDLSCLKTTSPGAQAGSTRSGGHVARAGVLPAALFFIMRNETPHRCLRLNEGIQAAISTRAPAKEQQWATSDS